MGPVRDVFKKNFPPKRAWKFLRKCIAACNFGLKTSFVRRDWTSAYLYIHKIVWLIIRVCAGNGKVSNSFDTGRFVGEKIHTFRNRNDCNFCFPFIFPRWTRINLHIHGVYFAVVKYWKRYTRIILFDVRESFRIFFRTTSNNARV